MREPLTISLTTAPAGLPLSLNQLKAQLRLSADQTDEDALLMGLLRSAVEHCEAVTGRALMSQTWTLFRDAWPCGGAAVPAEGLSVGPSHDTPARGIELPRPPLQSVIHVKTYDDSDNATTWAAANYLVDTAREPGRIVARRGQSLPLPARAANGIEIRFVAGYGDDPADVPEAIRHGLLLLTARLYEHRGDDMGMAARESGAARLWQSCRVLRL